MCAKCDGFAEKLNFQHHYEYRDMVRQLIDIVDEGTFSLFKATYPLEDVSKSPFPGDSIAHEFQCTARGRKFRLSADTYHARSSWEVIAEPA
jgi:hypothetical protein